MKMYLIFFLIVLFSFSSCKKGSQEQDKQLAVQDTEKVLANQRQKDNFIRAYVEFPDVLFGINFCKADLWSVHQELSKLKINHTCDNGKCPATREDMYYLEIETIESDFFLGDTLNQEYILSVRYEFIHTYDSFFIIIKMKDEYYDRVLQLLSDKFGYEKSTYDTLDYDELSWYADPDHKVKTCISNITLSHRLRYEDPTDGVFYLAIRTRGRSSHVH